MHPVPSGRSGSFNELISEEASVVGVSGGIPFCDCEVETGHLPTQTVVHREFHRDFPGWLDTCTGKGLSSAVEDTVSNSGTLCQFMKLLTPLIVSL